MLDFDTVVSAVGRPVILHQIALIRLAEESGTIKRFFPSEYGTDIEYAPSSAHEKTHQAKLAVRSYIRDHTSRLEHSYLVTGPYADFYLSNYGDQPKRGGFNVENKKAVLLGDGNGKVSLTTMAE